MGDFIFVVIHLLSHILIVFVSGQATRHRGLSLYASGHATFGVYDLTQLLIWAGR